MNRSFYSVVHTIPCLKVDEYLVRNSFILLYNNHKIIYGSCFYGVSEATALPTGD